MTFSRLQRWKYVPSIAQQKLVLYGSDCFEKFGPYLLKRTAQESF
jgi:hypothetical protein